MVNKKSYEIDLWELPSMNDKIHKILQDNGINEVSALSITNLPHLVRLNIPGSIADRLLKESEVLIDKFGPQFVMGAALLKEFEALETLTTGCSQLDAILDGGMTTNRLYEFYGLPRMGKTTMLFQLLCCAMLPKERGGLNCPVIYLDATGDFKTNKIAKIARRFGFTPQYVLDNIAKLDVRQSTLLIELLEKKVPAMMDNTGARLILLDGITASVRYEYTEMKNLPVRQGTLGKIANGFKKLNKAYNAISVVTNQVTGVPSADGVFRSYNHAGGNILGHEVQVRLAIRPVVGYDDRREIFLEKAVDLKQDTCTLIMDDGGFHDSEVGGSTYDMLG